MSSFSTSPLVVSVAALTATLREQFVNETASLQLVQLAQANAEPINGSFLYLIKVEFVFADQFLVSELCLSEQFQVSGR